MERWATDWAEVLGWAEAGAWAEAGEEEALFKSPSIIKLSMETGAHFKAN